MSLTGQRLFGGMRVVDLSTEIAGPYCTKMVVDAGTDVIKVAPPNGGDPLRRWTASGTLAAVGAVCAWRTARRTGKGQQLDLSMFETLLIAFTDNSDLNGQWRGGLLQGTNRYAMSDLRIRDAGC